MRRLAAVLPLVLPLVLAACLARTEAEDPLPGPRLEAMLLASEDGKSRVVHVSVLVEREFAEARRWFLEAPLLERWLAEEVTLPLEEGAAVRLAWPTHGAAVDGRVEELVPGSHLTIGLDPFAGAPATRLRLTAATAPGGVRVGIEHGMFPGDAAGEEVAERHRRAWFRALRVLQSALERRLPTTPAPPPEV